MQGMGGGWVGGAVTKEAKKMSVPHYDRQAYSYEKKRKKKKLLTNEGKIN